MLKLSDHSGSRKHTNSKCLKKRILTPTPTQVLSLEYILYKFYFLIQDVTVTDSLGASSFSSVQSDEDYALLLGNNSRGSTSTPMDSGIFEPVFLESQLATAGTNCPNP